MADNPSDSVSSSLSSHMFDIQNLNNNDSIKNADLIKYDNIR